MGNKKAVSAFWWVLIILFGVLIFVGVYILFTGTYVNDFWRYNDPDSNSIIEAGKSSSPDSSNEDQSSSDLIDEANERVFGTSFLNRTTTSNNSSSNVSSTSNSDSLPAPPTLP